MTGAAGPGDTALPAPGHLTAAGEQPSDPRVQAALDRLADADGVSPRESVAVFDDVHRRLDDVLADAAPEPAGGSTP